MSYTVLVFVKQVPDTQNITGDAMKADGTVNRAALPAIFNPEDLNALEMALELKDRYGAKVVVGTMGLPGAAEVLRQALYRGADSGILLTDRAFAGADTLATSFALSCCAKKVPFDLILCGRQAIDGDTAQVGPQLAEKLALPQIAYAEEVQSLGDGKVVVRRAIEGGFEVLESPLPALLTVVDANTPRPMAAKRIMKYKRARIHSEIVREHSNENYIDDAAIEAQIKDLTDKGLLITEWTAKDVDADLTRIGKAGSPTKVKAIASVVLTAGESKQVDPTAEGISELIHELISDHTLG